MNPAHDEGALVLVIDDAPRNVQVVGTLLRERGHRVAVALDGPQGIAVARETTPDVVLLDVMMPGMDGFAVCAELKRDLGTRSIPVIFLTARVDDETVDRAFSAGAVDYVTKPFRARELLARVEVHARMQRLRGLLSVCSFCQCIRNERGVWEPMGAYISRRSEATLSHGLCDPCLEKHYPDTP